MMFFVAMPEPRSLGIAMPDGSFRQPLKCMSKPQSQWTEEDSKEMAEFQKEHMEMSKRLADNTSEKP
jgi:hypothetical protein